MKTNPSKLQIMFLGRKGISKLCLNIIRLLILSSKQVKLLGVNIDNSLNFEAHIKELCRTFNQKVHALGEPKSKLLLTSVVMSNFSNYNLIWLFCSKAANNEINSTHKRALRALYGDYEFTFKKILDKDKSKTTHKKDLQNTYG